MDTLSGESGNSSSQGTDGRQYHSGTVCHLINSSTSSSSLCLLVGETFWLTLRELLVAQGFPLREAVIMPRDPPTTSFDVPLESRRRSSIVQRAGNAMHVNVVGLAFLNCVTQTVEPDAATSMASLLPMMARIIAEGD